jgi:hypothetical protein
MSSNKNDQENTKRAVDSFLENKDKYKVDISSVTGDDTPKDKGANLSSNAIGGKIYKILEDAYYSNDQTKKLYQAYGFETPEDYNEFLEETSFFDPSIFGGDFGSQNPPAEIHNRVIDQLALDLELAYGSEKCQTYTEQARAIDEMPNPDSLDFCTGEVTSAQLDVFLAARAALAESVAGAQQAFGLLEGAGAYNDAQSGSAGSAELNALRDTIQDNALGRQEDIFKTAIYGRRDPRYLEQCFLLTHAITFAKLKMDIDENGWTDKNGARLYNKPYPYYGSNSNSNASIMAHYDPFAFINRLTQSGAKSYFFDAPSSALSALQPMIRLYKVIAEKQDNGSTIEREVEINFDSYATQNDLSKLENKANRGFGAGIKSFDFKCNASNPFAIKKSISAKLVIFANNFGELYRDRDGTAISTNNSGEIVYTDVKYKYLDLALKTGDEDTFDYQRGGVDPRDANSAIYDATKLNFRLKAVVGWANPKATGASTTDGVGTGTINGSLLNAIYNSYITLNLTPTIHDFDIDELGRVTFSLNYLAYVEDFFDQPEYNIFTDPASTLNQIRRRIEQADANRKCDSQAVAATKGDDAQIKAIEAEKEANLRSLINNMVNTNKIRVFDIDIETLGKYKTGGPLLEIDNKQIEEFKKKITVGGEEAIPPDNVEPNLEDASELSAAGSILHGGGYGKGAADTRTGIPPAPKETFGNVAFFYVSDLVDVILSSQSLLFEYMPEEIDSLTDINQELKEEQVTRYQRHRENFKKFRVLLGPIELIKTTKGSDGKAKLETAIVNLGDLPISVKYFMEFMTEKMLKTDREVYPIGTFLNQFFNTFVSDFLNSDACYGGKISQKVRLFQSSITGFNNFTKNNDNPNDNYPDDMVYYMFKNGVKQRHRVNLYDSEIPFPALDVMGGRGQSTQTGEMADEINYLIYYAGRVQPMDTLLGNREADQERGIFHYQIGKDSGIVKSINLSKTDSPGLAEVRYEQEGYDGLQQLLVLYDANIKSFLDVTAFPGSYIYVEPRGFDPGLTDPKRFTNLGIGGYYMITEADHSLGPGTAETSITAKWVAQINNEIPPTTGDGETDPCTEIKTERKEKATGLDGVLESISGFFGFGE